MSLQFYKILHLGGLMMLFLALGGILALGANENLSKKRIITIFHGIGLFLLLLGGFGMIAKLHAGFPVWVIAKIGIWVLLAGLLTLGKRNFVTAKTLWIIALVLGLGAAWLGLFKPGGVPTPSETLQPPSPPTTQAPTP